jgi:two-component system, NarL family, response regulator YdfI
MIRAVIAASSDVARAGIATVVSSIDGVEVVGQASDVEELSRLVRGSSPDAVIVDIGSSDEELSHFLDAAGRNGQEPRAVVLSDELQDFPNADGRRSDAWALLPRRSGAAEIDAALRGVMAGLIVMHPGVLDRTAQPSAVRAAHDGSVLTPREIEVLRMLAAGLPNKTIAKRLGVSAHTVKFHVGSIMNKLHASSRTEAVTDGIRRGLIFV